MVRYFISTILLFNAVLAFAITPDELRAMSANKGREDEQRRERANTGELNTLIPKTIKPNPQQPKSSKYSSVPESNASSDKPKEGSKTRTQRIQKNNHMNAESSTDSIQTGSNIYIPPPREGGAKQADKVSDAVIINAQIFGIRLGTWISASLSRNTSSAEPGTVELTLSADVIGDKRTLPVGTVLFANKSLNSSTKRMEMTITNGITPNGHEFKMRGIVFDPQKISGLPGLFVIDEKAIAKHGALKGTVAAIGAATQQLGGAINPLAAAGGAATQSVLSDTSGAVDYNAPTAVIYVSPQPLIIRVEERF